MKQWYFPETHRHVYETDVGTEEEGGGGAVVTPLITNLSAKLINYCLQICQFQPKQFSTGRTFSVLELLLLTACTLYFIFCLTWGLRLRKDTSGVFAGDAWDCRSICSRSPFPGPNILATPPLSLICLYTIMSMGTLQWILMASCQDRRPARIGDVNWEEKFTQVI